MQNIAKDHLMLTCSPPLSPPKVFGLDTYIPYTDASHWAHYVEVQHYAVTSAFSKDSKVSK